MLAVTDNKLTRAEVELGETQQELLLIKSTLVTGNGDLTSPQNDVVSTQSRLTQVEADLIATRDKLESTEKTLAESKAQLFAARHKLAKAKLAAVKTKLSTTEEQLAAVQKDLVESKKEHAATRERLATAVENEFMGAHVAYNAPFQEIGRRVRVRKGWLLDKVLTHSSATRDKAHSYELLEYAGDEYIKIAAIEVTSEWRDANNYERHHMLTTKTVVELMGRNTTLARITRHYGLDRDIDLRVRPTDFEMTKIEGDVCEALAAAYWKEYGPEHGLEIIKNMIRPICSWIFDEIRAGRLWTHQPRGRRNRQ
ncbi:uncharacterized protein LOC62_02G002593 [Vanrija pseudolonga]|uniref:RNase III domain-containing protein n=1 Tax=Vanrija pseudolonga TaxID=143232 RepID=A0AAF0Y728_9TREE|nr:hypothetical protein LOC62_02G002593 [Vanrija pseudolonga]